MAKLFDADGKEIEALTQEEVAAATAKAVEDFKKAEADRVAKEGADKAAAEAAAGKTPLDKALAEIESIKGQLHQSRVREYGTKFAGNDAEKIKQFSESFGRLSGYEESDAGFELRAKDAARLAFGTDTTVDMSSMSGAGGRNIDANKGAAVSEADKTVRNLLGITDADVTKFAPDKK